jgi:hypothetical protein
MEAVRCHHTYAVAYMPDEVLYLQGGLHAGQTTGAAPSSISQAPSALPKGEAKSLQYDDASSPSVPLNVLTGMT